MRKIMMVAALMLITTQSFSAPTIFITEQSRVGTYSQSFSLPSSQPKRIKVKMVSSDFGTTSGLSISVKMEESTDGGNTWKKTHGFTADGGHKNDNSSSDPSGLPSCEFSWDGTPRQVRITAEIPIAFSCGMSYEVLG